MLRPHRFDKEFDLGHVQIQARKVFFDVSGIGLHWIPGHPVASNVISLLNVVLPAAERWFVDTLTEALPLVKDPHLADDMWGFIGQEAMHADVHEQVLYEYMAVNGIDPKPILDQVEFVFEKALAPTTSTDPKRRLNHLCDRLWLIAAFEHYTAVMGDFALNCAWDATAHRQRWSICSAGTAARRSNTAWWRTTSRCTSTTATSTGSAGWPRPWR